MTRARGFTLIELLVALALAGLVVAGAFQMHLAFSRQSRRQQQVAEIQQTLRVAMQVLERALRSAGDGLGSSHMLVAKDGACNDVDYYGFQFSNDNGYSDPKTSFGNGAAVDRDPDWFRVIATDTIADTGAVLLDYNANFTRFIAPARQSWNVADLFLVFDGCPGCRAAVRQVDAFSGSGTLADPGVLRHNKGGSCYNPNPGASAKNGDQCLGNFGCATPGAPLRHLAAGGTVYRVMTSADQGDASGRTSPKLTMRQAPFGTPFVSAAYPWIPIADNVEDMQLAVILDDGRVCTSIDDPRAGSAPDNCPFDHAIAVRVTLVGRSAQPIQGVPATPKGGYEDEPSVIPAPTSLEAYYLRRAMTVTVQLRNYAP